MTLALQLTVALALLTTSCSFVLWMWFRRSPKEIGRRVGHMLFGEFLSGVVLSAFAWLELTNRLQDFPVWAATTMRWTALLFMLRSSFWLAEETARIIREDRHGESDQP